MGENRELRIGTSAKVQFDGGICYDDETSIDLSQSPYGGLLNMCLDDGGMPTKRMGQQYVFENTLGDSGLILFVKLVNIKRKHKLPIIIECYKIH